MNRRQLLLAGVGVLIPISADKAELRVISHRLERRKRFSIDHGNLSTQVYSADSLHMTMSDGTEAESWIDPEGVLNIRGIASDDFNDSMQRGEVAEEFAKKHLKWRIHA